MIVRTSDLTGAQLDWAVVIAQGVNPADIYIEPRRIYRRMRDADGQLTSGYMTGPEFLPSKMWESGGPIIAREQISLQRAVGGEWHASSYTPGSYGITADGPTHLIAAMRCFVASKLGDEVDIPQELT